MKRAASRGHSLVSMLVGMTVGLIVMGVLFGIFVSLKTSYRAQTQLARLTASEMRVMDRLAQVVQTAGFYPSDEYNGVPRAQFNAVDVWKQGQAIGGASGASSDVLRTRLRIGRSETVRDCGGDQLPQVNVASMYVQTVRVGAAGKLECEVSATVGSYRRVYTLAEAVSHFRVRYGLDRDGDESVERYLDATGVEGARAWSEVVTVRFDLKLAHGLSSGDAPQELTQVVRVTNRE